MPETTPATHFDPALLRGFLAVADTGSFTRAAEQLGISQPAVSQQVRRLEQAAGRQLVVRDTRSVALTDNGEAMRGFARQILAAHDQASSYFSGSAMRGRLRFGAADEFALSDLPRILREFRQHHPGIQLELTVAQSGVLQRRLDSNHLDLILINQRPDSDTGRMVHRDQMVWVGLPNTVLEPGETVPLVTYHAPSWSRQAGIDALNAHQIPWRIVCNTRQVLGIMAAVRAGLGLCMLARTRVPGDLRVLSGRFGLPELPMLEQALQANPRSPREPVEALTNSIMNLPLAAIQR
ncbi:LysR substrate-binding domain-containing protein [Enemella evansiae]|uniref:LysR family transcriptional regulator n=1 Tax=Enemella evansiae TaxID=2016499 RepID=A0A255G815_9ACTN|nr:LysR substrate-binding domain-containing protein [Enemella evansiae]PFG66137.1 LysR family transcriptional regulator [Propionibacteriaceae bacterium ES.041]OYN94944.1 LysR family transcriptional regulator [Enemella evansiae]OYO04860.1 LysR family transcriptional regulator [Enemella evansiae]OYO06512.1 LysR family transcriptional regulator [Enemella evansiae]OYO07740.1 LysR family transcriptional regulator [Enemella evansiae]